MLRPFETGQIIQVDKRDPFAQIRPGELLGAPQATNSTPFQGLNLSSVINPIRPGMNASGGGLTLAGMAQQPMQQPMQNPFGGGLGSLNQQPFGGGLSSLNQQPQQMDGGLKGLLDSYIGNYINNYFMNALR